MVVVCRFVPVEHDVRLVVVGDQHVDIAVPVDVKTRNAAALGGVGETELAGPVTEHHARPRVVKEPHGVLPVVLVVDQVPAVDVQNVQIAVVFEVRRTGAPPPGAILHAPGKRGVLEFAVVVPIEEVAEVVAVQ